MLALLSRVLPMTMPLVASSAMHKGSEMDGICPLIDNVCDGRRMARFLVISTQRSGTHFLAQRLNVAGSTVASPGHFVYHADEALWRMNTSTFGAWCSSTTSYLQDACRAAPQDANAAGGVMMLTDFFSNGWGEDDTKGIGTQRVIDSLARACVRVIWYQRRNAFHQTVSELLHQQGQAPLAPLIGNAAFAAHLRRERLNVNAETLLWHVDRHVTSCHHMHRVLDEYNAHGSDRISYGKWHMAPHMLTWMAAYYEDVHGSVDELQHFDWIGGVVAQLLAFLGVPHARIAQVSKGHQEQDGVDSNQEPKIYLTAKVHGGCVLQYVVPSEHELHVTFRGTPYEWMISDGCNYTDSYRSSH